MVAGGTALASLEEECVVAGLVGAKVPDFRVTGEEAREMETVADSAVDHRSKCCRTTHFLKAQ